MWYSGSLPASFARSGNLARSSVRSGGLLLSRLGPLLLAASLSAQVQMTDVSAAAGLDGETYGSATDHSLGINWIDFDLDGWPDLFVVGGNPSRSPRLYHNQGNGTFSPAEALLPTLPAVEMSGSVFADYDNDGDLDVYIYTDHVTWDSSPETNPKDGPANLLLRNRLREGAGAGPLFEEVAAEAGLQDLADPPLGDEYPGYRAKTASFFDYDRDGCVDLFVGHWVMNSGGDPANRDRLFRNRCDGTFEDVTVSSGIRNDEDPLLDRAALASIGAHLDGDLWPDLYVVNAGGGTELQPYINDLFYRNNGDGTFTEVCGDLPGLCDDSQAGMGIDVADVDLDGDWDAYISDLRSTTNDARPKGNVLYLSDGAGGFADNSALEAGVQGHNSWGVSFFDLDHDTDEDLFVATMNGAAGEEAELLYRNEGNGTFTNLGVAIGMSTGNSRGSAVADYDGDGDLDLAVVNQQGSLQLFRNDTLGSGTWLQLWLRGAAGNRDGIGTVVEATFEHPEGEPLVLRRQVKGGSSAHSQDSLVVHFGLGSATVVDQIRILWPSGRVDLLEGVAAGQRLRFEEGRFFADGFESGDTSAWSGVTAP